MGTYVGLPPLTCQFTLARAFGRLFLPSCMGCSSALALAFLRHAAGFSAAPASGFNALLLELHWALRVKRTRIHFASPRRHPRLCNLRLECATTTSELWPESIARRRSEEPASRKRNSTFSKIDRPKWQPTAAARSNERNVKRLVTAQPHWKKP